MTGLAEQQLDAELASLLEDSSEMRAQLVSTLASKLSDAVVEASALCSEVLASRRELKEPAGPRAVSSF